ncbi:hypothetical protein HZQ56_17820 [Elizabethkingia anophelis]|nr:hypothetical protein [Elizabethkingia anophelis]MCT3875037.1 hypothetical protein [Elizabethkingia anophelis]
MKRLEQLYTEMKSEIPFVINEELKPYILELAQIYAREVAQASLEKVAENANMKVVILGIEDCSQMTKSFYHKPSATEISLNKSSITNESNITLL